MIFEKDFKVEEMEDKSVDKAGNPDVQLKRRIVLVSDDVKVTMTGTPSSLIGFRSGEKVQVLISNPQKTLSEIEEEGE